MIRRGGTCLVVLAICVLAVPAVARAQSAIAGVVKDASGAVLPGVTVEAASDVLIEKTRSAITDGAGQYKIIDLRPGVYTVTFTIPGFQTVKRERIDLPSEFTATINGDMKVGAIEETVIVTTQAPMVDVQTAAHVQVLDREAIDNLPTGRTIQALGQTILGVSLSLPDVGGSRSAMQTYMSVRGNSAANNTVLVDGMQVNGVELNGAVQSYFNDSMSQEMSYQTSGIDASVSSGGVRLNMIPKDGGNRFSGNAQYSNRPGQWQGINLTPRLKTAGLAAGNTTEYIRDLTGSFGGPIKRDRLWFFGAARDYRTLNGISNTYFDGGSKGTDYNYIRDGLGRVTYQMSAKNKLSGYYDRISKYRSNDMQSLTDPETASVIWTSPNYSTGGVKWTSPITNRILFEGGWAFNIERRNTEMQSGIEGERNSAEWFANASRQVVGAALGGGVAGSPTSVGSEWPDRYSYNFNASYITGSHHIKVGTNGTYGRFFHEVHSNGDLTELFQSVDTSGYLANGGPLVFRNPVSVTVRNTPRQSQENINSDVGVYAQDSWTLSRLTLNAGIRFEHFNAGVAEMTAPAGRFVPARTMKERNGIPNWNDWAPRFQAVYDLFGNSKTAIKYSVNRYNAGETTTVASTFNPLGTSTRTLDWTDLNGDLIAQGARSWNADGTAFTDCVYLTPGCEIRLSNELTGQPILPSNFGLLSDITSGIFPRQYSIEHGFEVQHELLPRLSVGFSLYRGSFKNLTTTINRAITPADYTAVTIFNPVDGKPFDVYNLNAAASGRAADNFTFIDQDRRNIFNSYSAEFRARPGRGATLFGGVSWDRQLRNAAAVGAATNNCTVGRLQDPNLLRLCDDFNLEDGTTVPYAVNVRLNGTYPLPWLGLIVSGVFQSNADDGVAQTYTITKATRYPDGSATYLGAGVPLPACASPCPAGALILPATFTQASVAPRLRGSNVVRGERLNQLDVKLGKTFRFGHYSVTPNFEAFNITNSDKVISYASTSYAASGYLRPNSIVQGRILGIGTSVRW